MSIYSILSKNWSIIERSIGFICFIFGSLITSVFLNICEFEVSQEFLTKIILDFFVYLALLIYYQIRVWNNPLMLIYAVAPHTVAARNLPAQSQKVNNAVMSTPELLLPETTYCWYFHGCSLTLKDWSTEEELVTVELKPLDNKK